MKNAYLAIRDGPHYRRDVFAEGLRRAGYKVHGRAEVCGDGDLIVMWNRYGSNHQIATVSEQRGATVLVAENGYLGNLIGGQITYAMSRSFHNGAGWWPDGGPERWASYGIELQPWKPEGETVILPQRGIGCPGVAMPLNWPSNHERYGRMRKHPGNAKGARTLEQDLAKAGSVITWGSGAAMFALVYGVPVFYCFPKWIGAEAATPFSEFPKRKTDDAARLRMFERMAWAQWSLDEIGSGEVIKRLT